MAESSTAEDIFFPEKIVDSGFGQQDGKRYYKVKWVRYSWEAEDTLDHLKELVDSFWTEHGGLPETKAKETPPSSNPIVTSGEKTVVEAVLVNPPPEEETPQPQVEQDGKSEPKSDLMTVLLKPQDVSAESNNKPDELTQGSTAIQNITTTSAHSTYTDENGKEVKYVTIEKHTCDICLRVFHSAPALRTHKRSAHKPDKQFRCETCLKMFSEKSTLRRHMYIHLEEKPFKCEHCNKGFSDKSTLRRHLLTHTGIKRFQCNCCEKRFTRNEHLRQHMFIHTEEKIYKCDVCMKNFRQRSTLKNHMLLHRADNAIKCELCGALFSKQMQLDKHQVWCNGSTSTFKCDICEKSFVDRSCLKRHLVLHSGERPYKCEYCDQAFNDRSVLRRHLFKHTDKKPFQCAVCNKEFLRKATLQSHVSREHTDEVNRSMFGNLVHAYDMSDSISFSETGLEQHVQFVIQPDETAVDSTGNQVEVSSNNIQQPSDGVSVLAHAVCNIPNDSLLTGINEKQVVPTSQPLELVNQDLQPGENQVLQVQIIQMENGNQIVQSIHTLAAPADNSLVVSESNLDGSNALHIDEPNALNSSNENTVQILQSSVVTVADNTLISQQNPTMTDQISSAQEELTIDQPVVLDDHSNLCLNISEPVNN